MSKNECEKLPQLKTINEIELLVRQYKKGEKAFKNLQDEISFLYDIGSFYAEYYQIKDPIRTIFRDEDKYYIGIYYYLKAIRIYEDNKNILDNDTEFIFGIIRRLYVNIGNDFSNQFRSINALSYFRKALEIDSCFDMAIGNFALGIEHHSPLVGLSEDKYCMVFNLLYELYYLSFNFQKADALFFCEIFCRYFGLVRFLLPIATEGRIYALLFRNRR